MPVLFSSVVSVILRAVRKSSKGLVRDFNEIRYLQSSTAAASEFTMAAYVRSGKIIAEELQNCGKRYDVLLDGCRDVSQLSETFWFVSPIDSRTNFMNCLPYFTTSVALVKDEKVVAAVIDSPILQETFYADRGSGAFAENGQSRYLRMQVGSKQSITGAVIDFTADSMKVLVDSKLSAQSVVLRSMGSVTLGISYLCTARCDLLIYSGMHKYKAAMGKLFIEESRGCLISSGNILAGGNFYLCEFLQQQKFL